MLKCNIYGVIFQNSNSIGVSMISGDDTGSFVATRSYYFNDLESVKEVEIIGLVEGFFSWDPLKGFLN